jgi:hypothetical protein
VENGETGFFGGSSQQSGANSITVVGSNQYVAGYDYNDSVSIVKYWGPGVFFDTDGWNKEAMANSITVEGSDVYVAGYESNGAGVIVAKY